MATAEPGNEGTVLRPIPFGVDPDPAATATAATEAVAVAAAAALTDAQLRATAVPVNVAGGTVNVIGSITAVGPLTNTQLRATAVPVSGPLTDAQLRASAVPISAASLPLPSGAATEVTLVQVRDNGAAAAVDAAAAAASIIATAVTTAAATAATAALLAQIRDAIPATDPFFLEATTGLVNGNAAKTLHIKGRRAGFNTANISQDVAEYLGVTADIMGELTGAEAFEVVSSSASDSAAGVGVRTVRLTYIDASNNLVQSASFTMNGVTPVPLTGITANMLLWLQAVTGGTTEGAVGNILLRIAGGGATHDQISIGENRSLAGRFMVPAGFTAYVRYWQVSTIGGGTFDSRFRAGVNVLDRTVQARYVTQFHAFAEAGQAIVSELPWVKFPALCKMKLSTIPSAAGATNRIHSDFSVLLVAD